MRESDCAFDLGGHALIGRTINRKRTARGSESHLLSCTLMTRECFGLLRGRNCAGEEEGQDAIGVAAAGYFE
jgi:hypothetical protein